MNPVQILWINSTESTSFQGVKPHEHPFYHAIYLVSGGITATVAGKELELSANSFVIVPKETMHAFQCTRPGSVFLEVKFTVPDASLDARVCALTARVVQDAAACGLFRRIVAEYTQKRARAEEAAGAYLLSILYCLTEESRQGSTPVGLIDTTGYSELSRKIITYLEQNADRDVALDELAQEMDMSKNYLCNAFRRDTGTTIGNCKNTLRIRKAAELITYSDLSLSAISEQCGFATVAHFNRVFTKYVGLPPIKCRRAYPADCLLYQPQSAGTVAVENKFIYSVLANKQIALRNTHGDD